MTHKMVVLMEVMPVKMLRKSYRRIYAKTHDREMVNISIRRIVQMGNTFTDK
jgi:hypothetical protein